MFHRNFGIDQRNVGCLKWSVIYLVWVGDFQVFIVALYRDKVHDLNSCHELPPPPPFQA